MAATPLALSVTQVSTSDTGGGAERIALDLHRSFIARGVDARLVVGLLQGDRKELGLSSFAAYEARPNIWSRTLRQWAPDVGRAQANRAALLLRRAFYALSSPAQAIRRVEGQPGLQAGAAEVLAAISRTSTRKKQPLSILMASTPTSSILQLHNLHGEYFDLAALPVLSAAVPTFITLHDAWLTTGHCAHGLDCERWRDGCGSCPHLDFPPPLTKDHTAQLWQAKRGVLQQSVLHVIAPSQYMAHRIEGSILAPAVRSLTVIPNGVDPAVFHPVDTEDKLYLRTHLGLPADAFVICYSAVEAQTNPYKDTGSVLKACARLRELVVPASRPIIVVVIGGQSQQTLLQDGGFITIDTGYLAASKEVADWMRASDILVHAAHAEAFGLTSVEAQLCGLPVVVTRVGGLPETVEDGRTGFVVSEGDAGAIAEHLAQLYEDAHHLQGMGEAAALFATEHFTLAQMADRYLELYEQNI